MGYRIGYGEDLHRLVEGRPLILAGKTIPHDKGCLGHSDGDVVFHAVADALLSACGERDIGFHFPPGDPKIEGIDSAKILSFAYGKAKKAGLKLANLSLVIIAEEPKLSPYVDDMKTNLATLLDLEPNRVGITCKTNEGLGEIGAGKALACRATLLLEE